MYAEDIFQSQDETAESFDESLDDESFDTDAEFLPFIGRGIQQAGNALGSLLGGAPVRRAPLPRIQIQPSAGGVGTATLNTPRGNAVLRLPEKVVSKDEFKQVTDRLQEAINRNTARLNTTQDDLGKLRQQIGSVVADTRRELGNALTKVRREQRAAIAKLRKDQSSQNMTNLMMSMMTQQQISRRIDEHKHSVTIGKINDPSQTETATTEQPAKSGSDNSAMMMMLPLLMGSSQDGNSGDNNMMLPLMMMMAFNNR